MLGPFKIIGPFVKLTESADISHQRQIAFRAILFSTLGVLFAAFLGEYFLNKFDIPVSILALTGGLILFLVALANVIATYNPPTMKEEQPAPTIKLALNPLAFPIIVTPYGIAAVIVFMAISPGLHEKLIIGGIVVGIMALNLIMMLLTRYIGKIIFLFLSIIGAVLSVIQVALGLMIVYTEIKILCP
jgi:multiple antibiotic resistance protein